MKRQNLTSVIRLSRIVSLSLLMLLTGGQLKPEAAQTVSFGAPTGFPTGQTTYSVAVGDFDCDGKLDLAAANFLSHNVSILLGTGTGGFVPKPPVFIGSTLRPFAVAVGDFNCDGKPDLAVTTNSVLILMGDGTGSFMPKPSIGIGTGDYERAVAVGDFNNDCKPDLAVASVDSVGSGIVSILIGLGTGSFMPHNDFDAGLFPRAVAVGDFNNDCNLDLAVANSESNTVSILLGTGTGSFGPHNDFGVGSRPRSVAVGDFDRDGKLDLAVVNYSGNNVSILIGKGTGSFEEHNDLDTGIDPLGVAVGDFNGDGKLDLAVPSSSNHTVSILPGMGTGSFDPKIDVVSRFASSSAAVGDFNRDGKLDLAITSEFTDRNSILLNTTGYCFSGFRPKTNFDTGSQPISVTAGDFDNDGKLDLATANFNSNNVSILLGDGTGIFMPKPPVELGTGSFPRSVAVGDFNCDGNLDLAAANFGKDTVSILLGDGTGSFMPRPSVNTGSQPAAVVVGDFNCDGMLDLAVANRNGHSVSILIGNGAGSFVPMPPVGAGVGSMSIAVGDFNRDCKLDLAVANFFAGTVSILRGTGTGSFVMGDVLPVGGGPVSVAVGDLNRDGKLDLAVVNSFTATVSILPGTGTGSFGPKTTFDTGTDPLSIVVGDFNRNGTPDLLTANQGSDTVSLLRGTVTGSFGSKSNYGTGSLPSSVAAGDFNCDGKLDLATANLGSDNVSILLNGCFMPGVTTAGVINTAGNSLAHLLIGTMAGTEEDYSALIATINGGMSATVNGVTVRLSPNAPTASGQIFADVVAACAATTANFTVRVTDSEGLFSEATLTVTVSPDFQPPTIICPVNITSRTATINALCAMVTLAPVASDNCPGVTQVCSPPSGACFPVGTTGVTCTASDESGNTAACSFTVSVFNVCLQDDANPATVFLANSITGAYRFCCGGTTVTGVAQVTRRGNILTVQHIEAGRRVQATDDEGVFKGTASLQSPPGTYRCLFQDRDTRNNTGICQ